MEVACSGGSLCYKIKSVNIFCFNFTSSRKHLIFALVVVSIVLERYSKPHTIKTILWNTIFQKQMTVCFHVQNNTIYSRVGHWEELTLQTCCYFLSPLLAPLLLSLWAEFCVKDNLGMPCPAVWWQCYHLLAPSPFPGLKKSFLLNTL